MSLNEVEHRSCMHGPGAWVLSGLCVSTNLMTVVQKQNRNTKIPSEAPHNLHPSSPCSCPSHNVDCQNPFLN